MVYARSAFADSSGPSVLPPRYLLPNPKAAT